MAEDQTDEQVTFEDIEDIALQLACAAVSSGKYESIAAACADAWASGITGYFQGRELFIKLNGNGVQSADDFKP